MEMSLLLNGARPGEQSEYVPDQRYSRQLVNL